MRQAARLKRRNAEAPAEAARRAGGREACCASREEAGRERRRTPSVAEMMAMARGEKAGGAPRRQLRKKSQRQRPRLPLPKPAAAKKEAAAGEERAGRYAEYSRGRA